MTKQILLVIATTVMLCSAAAAGTVNIALVPVGDPGNVADPLTGYGSVAYSYSIGEYDVTMGQYAAFLNAVASTSDPYGCWNASMSSATPTYGITRTSTSAGYVYAAKGNSADVPVTYVSWFDAARFVNWLSNGEPVGSEGTATTEAGSYDLSQSQPTRGTSARWVLPTLNEWYKSAYYSGSGSTYWTYATQSNDVPSNVLSATGTNNANYTAIQGNPATATLTDPTDWLTPVGGFADSPSFFGTYDQSGDVFEWNESADGASRGNCGGGYASGVGALISAVAGGYSDPTLEVGEFGFRVAHVPEPSTGAILLSSALAGYVALKRRRIHLRWGNKGENKGAGHQIWERYTTRNALVRDDTHSNLLPRSVAWFWRRLDA